MSHETPMLEESFLYRIFNSLKKGFVFFTASIFAANVTLIKISTTISFHDLLLKHLHLERLIGFIFIFYWEKALHISSISS